MSIRNQKVAIIKRQGTDVEVHRLNLATPLILKTKALIGRGNRSNTNMKQLESQKEGIFYPDMDIDGGDFVYNHPLNESYVVAGVHQESYGNSILSKVVNLLKCNRYMTVGKMVDGTDGRGNLTKVFETTVEDMPCYLQEVTADLKQTDPGLHPEAEYRVYTTKLTVEYDDQISFEVAGTDETFKVVARDYTTFPGMLVLEIRRDIRK